MNGGKPFQSKLEPHFDFILESRRKRQTWEAIARQLAVQGITTTKQAVHAFLKRRLKRRYPLGMDPALPHAPIEAVPMLPTAGAELTESPPPSSDFTADALTLPLKGRKRSLWTVIKPQS